MHLIDNLPISFKERLSGFELIKDEVGMSPAVIYIAQNAEKELYLKISHRELSGTTYDVLREAAVMKWLKNTITVPEVILTETQGEYSYLLMRKAKGDCLEFQSLDSYKIVEYYASCIKMMHDVDISSCEFNSKIHFRLNELERLSKNGLTSIQDFENDETPFSKPDDLIEYLKMNIFEEELVFSHGDLSDGNLFTTSNKIESIIDWGRGGIADKWYDVALCIRNIREDIGEEKYVEYFLNLLNVKPDWEKINYFIWLDVLF